VQTIDDLFIEEIAELIVDSCRLLGQSKDFQAGIRLGKATKCAKQLRGDSYQNAQMLLTSLYKWAHSENVPSARVRR
jgi:hypothetical protein